MAIGNAISCLKKNVTTVVLHQKEVGDLLYRGLNSTRLFDRIANMESVVHLWLINLGRIRNPITDCVKDMNKLSLLDFEECNRLF